MFPQVSLFVKTGSLFLKNSSLYLIGLVYKKEKKENFIKSFF